MRKQSKSLLSMILTAAMVVSLGAGVTGEKSKAADATKIAPEFTAYLVQNNSKIFNGTDRVVKDSTGAVKQVDAAYKLAAGETEEVNGGFVASTGAISTTGTYTVSAVAEDDVDDLLTEASYLGVEFGTLGAKDVSGKKNYVVPSTYSIKPKTITVTLRQAFITMVIKQQESFALVLLITTAAHPQVRQMSSRKQTHL